MMCPNCDIEMLPAEEGKLECPICGDEMEDIVGLDEDIDELVNDGEDWDDDDEII